MIEIETKFIRGLRRGRRRGCEGPGVSKGGVLEDGAMNEMKGLFNLFSR